MSVPERPPALPESIDHKTVIKLAWPLVVSMLSYTAMGLVDTLFVGRLGTAPLAAVGLAAVVVFLLQAFPMGLMAGARVVVSQGHGAGDADRARRAARLAVVVGLGLGGLGALVGSLGAPLLSAMGAEGAVLEHGEGYLRVRMLGAPGVLLTWAVGAWFQGRGDTRTPMRATLLANALNVLLDPIFIFGWGPLPALGVEGAALTTSLAFTLNGLILATRAHAGLRGPPPGRRDLDALWRLGSPIGARYVLDVASFVLFAAVLARVGEVALAAHVVVVRVASVSFLPGNAIAEAAGVLVGQAVGAARPALARQAWRSAVTLALGVMGACSVLFVAVPEALLRPFGAADAVLATGVALLRVAAAFQIADAVAVVGLGVLNGAGDTRFTMRASVACAWLVKLPVGVGLALGLGWGATGAWLGLTAEIGVVALLCAHRVRGAGWLVSAVGARTGAAVAAK